MNPHEEVLFKIQDLKEVLWDSHKRLQAQNWLDAFEERKDPAQIKRDVVREIRELRKHLRELQYQFEQ